MKGFSVAGAVLLLVFGVQVAAAESLWPDSFTPPKGVDTSCYSLATPFKANVAGSVSAVRFYWFADSGSGSGVAVGLYRASDRVLLGSATVVPVVGWNNAAISPVTLAVGAQYEAVYEICGNHAAQGNYAIPFSSAGGSLTVPGASDTTGGYYNAGGTLSYAVSQYNASEYFADVVFDPAGATATPTSTATAAPTNTATAVPTNTSTAVPTSTATGVPTATATGVATAVPTATVVPPTSTPVVTGTVGTCVNPGNPPANAGYDYVTAANTYQSCQKLELLRITSLAEATQVAYSGAAAVAQATAEATAVAYAASTDASGVVTRQAGLGVQALAMIGAVGVLAVFGVLYIPAIWRGR